MGVVYAKELPSNGPNQVDDSHSQHEVVEREEVEVDLAKTPAHVQKVHIDGLGRTKNDFVTDEVDELFKAENFEDMIKKCAETKMKLNNLGIFKKISILVDTSKGEKARPDGYEVTFKVEEMRRVGGTLNTHVGTNDGTVSVGAKLPNIFGRGEKFDATYTYGTKNTVGYNATFRRPLKINKKWSVSSSIYRYSGDFPWSGYSETNTGIDLNFNFKSIFGDHALGWDGVWRDLGCINRQTAFVVREQCGHTLKSSLKHTVVQDHRDNKILPNHGSYLRITEEFAGLGGDVQFLKHDMELQLNRSFILDTVLQLCLAGGVMKGLHGKTMLNDRFYVGGPLTLRGFNLRGAGPNSDGNSLGAETYLCGGLHMYTPLPFRPGKGGFGELFRTHFFVNAGNAVNVDFNTTAIENLQQLVDTVRLTYGMGVVLNLGGVARLELNYCIPVKSQPGDSVNPGVQFGIGVSYL
ncbi:unnamed protein product [Owenia fusiformis]|uniref:Bacterial surface antigen (D15) domain-containing protein n=1 Tax=Owenia fusiformis TaxID=6347 RepID=A0A8S4NZS3_OWEFU|nr:unnamed protein product [Owenia fusiformis]